MFFLLVIFFLFLYFSRKSRTLKSEYKKALEESKKLSEEYNKTLEERKALSEEHSKALEEHRKTSEEYVAFQERYKPVTDIEAERRRIEEECEITRKERQENEGLLVHLRTEIERLQVEFNALDEEANLQAHGLYKPRYDFATSEKYQVRLNEIRERQKRMVKDGTAAVGSDNWTVGGSAAKGRQMIKQTLNLALRAFNGECDASIAKVRHSNFAVMERRIKKAFDVVNKLVKSQSCEITQEYLDLKLEELALAFEYQERLQMEKEEQRQIREEMREEERAQRELEKVQKEAEKEEKAYEDALARARREAEEAIGEQQEALLQQVLELQQKLAEAQENKERAISQAQLTRSGHVYIISNIGSFGDDVYKIGMTRRLDPMDRVRELGDASVPFGFDVHAIIYTEDAPALESALHSRFHQRRVNRINERKEFFRVSLEEIAGVVQEHHGEIELTLAAEARDYRETLALIEEEMATMRKKEAV